MYNLIESLYPICRSITGDGVRATLDMLKRQIDLNVIEVPSGLPVFDWVVPREWNIRDAFIKNAQGERVVDFRESNLHVLNYSIPIHQTMTLDELKPHLFSLPDHPDWIPYRTSYYNENWGFCLTYNQLMSLSDETYEVCIDSTLAPGSLTYGEYVIAGESTDEVLISCHVCHPSLCNDNLSGIAVAVFLAKLLTALPLRYTYRFLFIPGTIGSITWLATHEEQIERIKHGFVLTCAGDPANVTYKRSRRGDAEVDRAMTHVLEQSGAAFKLLDFYPYGYDERQYCSPAFNLPVGVIMRSQHGTFPQYHTSADNLDFVQPASLADTLRKCLELCQILEGNERYLNLFPKGEPQLGKRGIYKAISGQQSVEFDQMALFWVLNFSDGLHSLLDIAERSKIKFAQIERAASLLKEHGLIESIPAQTAER
ncbi:MAG: DUF4910 domain-containing protein [Chloroflexota bacterium]